MTEPAADPRGSTEAAAAVNPSDNDNLLQGLASAILTVPGVVRLEPTLKGTLRRVIQPGRQLPVRKPPSNGTVDGITLHHRSGPNGQPTTRVTVDIATTDHIQARHTANAVQHTVTTYLQRHGTTPDTVVVNVLSVEPPTH